MPFQPLDEFLDPTLRLPVTATKSYIIQPPTMEFGLYLQRMEEAVIKVQNGQEVTDEERQGLVLDDDEERVYYRRLLGPAYDEMLADGVSWPFMRHMAATAYRWIVSGVAAAEEYWTSAAPKEELAVKQPQDRKVSAKSGRPASPARTTRKRASSGTGSPRRSNAGKS